MPIPELGPGGFLPEGLHAASVAEVGARFGAGSPERVRQFELLQQVVEAAGRYTTIKRVLVWGSFVTAKVAPRDLDYSLVVSVDHQPAIIAASHRRFLVELDARIYYKVDRAYLSIRDYPFDTYVDRLDFVTRNRQGIPIGLIEISLRGERAGGMI